MRGLRIQPTHTQKARRGAGYCVNGEALVCDNCGYTCEEYRCPDDTGYMLNEYGEKAQDGTCSYKFVSKDPTKNGILVPGMNWKLYYGCYNAKTPCERCAEPCTKSRAERKHGDPMTDGVRTEAARWMLAACRSHEGLVPL